MSAAVAARRVETPPCHVAQASRHAFNLRRWQPGCQASRRRPIEARPDAEGPALPCPAIFPSHQDFERSWVAQWQRVHRPRPLRNGHRGMAEQEHALTARHQRGMHRIQMSVGSLHRSPEVPPTGACESAPDKKPAMHVRAKGQRPGLVPLFRRKPCPVNSLARRAADSGIRSTHRQRCVVWIGTSDGPGGPGVHRLAWPVERQRLAATTRVRRGCLACFSPVAAQGGHLSCAAGLPDTH